MGKVFERMRTIFKTSGTKIHKYTFYIIRNVHALRMCVFLSDLWSATQSVYKLSLFLQIYVILISHVYINSRKVAVSYP
jgi:hypothetical protein